MDKGTIFFTFPFPIPWPVKNPITMREKSDHGDEFKLHAYPDGHLSFEHKSISNLFDYHIQPIKTTVGAMVVFDAAWNGPEVDVCINGITLHPFSTGIETATIEGKSFIEQPFELASISRMLIATAKVGLIGVERSLSKTSQLSRKIF